MPCCSRIGSAAPVLARTAGFPNRMLWQPVGALRVAEGRGVGFAFLSVIFMLTVFAFLLAIGILITIHEYGHYRVAVACGVKVLRFSIGFGKPLLRWHRPQKGLADHRVEFVLAAIPLGGYVRMLDSREGSVPEEQQHLAFDAQPLWQRTLIVLAGPLANLVLAVLLYSAAAWMGSQQALPVVAPPAPHSIAHAAGLRGGEHISHALLRDSVADNVRHPSASAGAAVAVRSFDDLRWLVTQAAVKGQGVTLFSDAGRRYQLRFDGLDVREVTPELFESIGISTAHAPAAVRAVLPGSPAAAAGLRSGDTVIAVDDRQVAHNHDLLRYLMHTGEAACSNGAEVVQVWTVQRASQAVRTDVRPELKTERGQCLHRVGIELTPPASKHLRYGFFAGLERGVQKTWEFSALTLRMLGQMLTGQASVKNLSGPLTIADVAGKSASMGLYHYLSYLAIFSVSLGVFNLLPIPVLDGGHLMYYLWEFVTGSPPSELWTERIQFAGFVAILLLMFIAITNDIGRYYQG